MLLFLNFVEQLDEAYLNGEFKVDAQADPGPSAPHSQALDSFGMPAVGERRYYRRSSTEGWEVLLLRRVQGARWVVLLPDQGMRSLMVNHRRSVSASPVVSVKYMALPVLSDAQKKVFYDGAAEMIQQNRVGTDMPLYVAGASVHRALAAQVLFGMLGLPGYLRAGARWALRSRSRSIAMVIMVFLFYEGLDILGIFRTFHEWGASCLESFSALRYWLSEINETTLEWVEFMERFYVSATSVMSLRRWLLVFVAFMLFLWSWIDRHGAGSETSTTMGSEDSGDRDRSFGGGHLKSVPIEALFADTNAALRDLLEANRAMKEEINDMRTAQRAVELRRDATSSEVVGVKAAQDHKKELTRMFERLDSFETMLRDHAVGQKGTIMDPLPHSRSAGEVAPSSPVGSTTVGVEVAEVSPGIEISCGGVKSEAIQQAVAKMKQKAMLPQQLFMQQLEDYREIDSETWNAQFGVGFRERLAALFLAEVFSTGKTGEQWGQDYVRDHGLKWSAILPASSSLPSALWTP